MKIKSIITVLKSTTILYLFILHSSVFAQNYYYEKYDWETKPTPIKFIKEFEKEKEVELYYKKAIELVVEEKQVYNISVMHRQLLVNSDAAIEENNKIYVLDNERNEIVKNKTRVIYPNGKISELSDKDIQTAQDEKSKQTYKYYAVPGLEKGCIIEQLLIRKEYPTLNGAILPFQSEEPSVLSIFELIYPSYLKYKVKTYNGLAEAQTDTIAENKIRMTVKANNIPAFHEEKYSNSSLYKQYLMYKLTANAKSNNMNSFREIGERIYNNLNKELSTNDNKELKNVLKQIELKKAKTIIDTIKIVESYVKSNINYDEEQEFEKNELSDILSRKKADKYGIMLVYNNIFKALKIKIEIVATASRFNYPFDTQFENQNQLKDYLIYFPSTKEYLDPENIILRYPLITNSLLNNNGLFIKSIELGGNTIAQTETRKISVYDSKYSSDTLHIEVNFSKNIENPEYTYTWRNNSFEGLQFQLLGEMLDEKQRQEVYQNQITNYSKEPNLKVTAQNIGTKNMGFNPIILTSQFNSDKLIEKAGNEILFKVGESIGPQTELYQEEARKADVDMYFPHEYNRKIEITVPKEYQIKNTEALNINHNVKDSNGKEIGAFHSSYTISGNKLTIICKEYYNFIVLPQTQYEDFKNTINAAADFNKVVLQIVSN